jgi:hypothetical protein
MHDHPLGRVIQFYFAQTSKAIAAPEPAGKTRIPLTLASFHSK